MRSVLRRCILVLLLVAAASAQAELLLNPGFETAQADPEQALNWNRFGDWANRKTAVPDGWDPRSGNALVAWQYYTETGANAGWFQEVTGLTDGGNYNFSVYAKRDSDYNGGNVNIKVEPIGGGSALVLHTWTMAEIGTDWTYINVAGSLGSGVTGGRFTIETLEGSSPHSGSIKLDDASLLEAVPEPTVVSLIGLGLVLMSARRLRGRV